MIISSEHLRLFDDWWGDLDLETVRIKTSPQVFLGHLMPTEPPLPHVSKLGRYRGLGITGLARYFAQGPGKAIAH